jgi:hypothetical protein
MEREKLRQALSGVEGYEMMMPKWGPDQAEVLARTAEVLDSLLE